MASAAAALTLSKLFDCRNLVRHSSKIPRTVDQSLKSGPTWHTLHLRLIQAKINILRDIRTRNTRPTSNGGLGWPNGGQSLFLPNLRCRPATWIEQLSLLLELGWPKVSSWPNNSEWVELKKKFLMNHQQDQSHLNPPLLTTTPYRTPTHFEVYDRPLRLLARDELRRGAGDPEAVDGVHRRRLRRALLVVPFGCCKII